MQMLVGWLSSLILVVTLGQQVLGQWRSGTSDGVSPALFFGQVTSSIGLAWYSWTARDWLYVSLNLVMGLTSVVGWAVLVHHRRRRQLTASVRGEVSLSH